MDIYYCDECGTRVTDLDLRAGRGMRKRHDTICSGCVDQGLAGAWLARSGQALASKADGGGSKAGGAAVAVAEAPDPISLGRDRARTQPDDPFGVDEPVPLKPKATSGPETDAIPASAARPSRQTPGDDLAAAGGGFGALVGSAMPSPPAGLVDEPEEPQSEDPVPASDNDVEVTDVPAGPLASAPAESPFDFVHPKDNNNPGKSETEEVPAIGPKDETRAEERRTASGRQVSQKRGATGTSKRTPAKAASTRRSGSARAQGNKVILFSVISCAVMLIIFTIVMINRGGPRTPGQVIKDEPLTNLQGTIDEAKRDSSAAMQTDDPAKVERAIASVRRMQASFLEFQGKAKNWNEDAHGEQLRRMGYYDVMASLRDLNNRKVILENRNK